MRHLAVAVATGLLLAGCSTSSSSAPHVAPTPVLTSPTATHTTKPKPPPPPPNHTCYRLGYGDALAPTSTKAPVPCSGTHTAVTFFVGSYRRHLAVDGAPVQRLVSTQCPRRFASFVGGTRDAHRLSLLRTVWFTPTADEAALGAHWFRCVAIALRDEQHLALLRGPVAGALDRPAGRAHYGLCGTAEPGTSGFQQRICAAPHSWQALRTIDFPPGRYPGTAKVKAAGQQPCKDAARAVASDPLSYQWSYQWPTLQQWRGGHPYGVCWAPEA